MLSKFATAVVFLLTVGSAVAYADPPATTVAAANDCNAKDGPYTELKKARTALADLKKNNPSPEDLKAANEAVRVAQDDYNTCTGHPAVGDCTSAGTEYYNAAHDLSVSCGSLDCNSFAACSDDDLKNSSPTKAGIDEAKKTCSALAGSGLNKLQDQLQKDKERLDTLKDKATDAQKDSSTGMKDTTKDLNDIRKEMSQNQSESADKIAQIQKDSASQQKELVQAIAEIQNHVDELNDQANQQVIAQQQAHDTMENAKVTAMMNCQQQASAQVAGIQAQVLAQMKAGTYNRGSINDLTQNVGMSDRQSWQRVANKYYNYCLSSAMTLQSFAAANRSYNTSVLAVQKQTASIQQKINTAKGQILMKDNGAGCGSMGPQTEKCQDLMLTQQQMQQESANLQNKNAGLAQNGAALQQQGMQDQMQKMQAAQGAQQEYADEKTRTDNLEKLINAKLAAGGSVDDDAKDLRQSYNKFKFKVDRANFLKNCFKTASKDCPSDAQCNNASEFLDQVAQAKYSNANRYDTSGSGDSSRTPANSQSVPAGGTGGSRD